MNTKNEGIIQAIHFKKASSNLSFMLRFIPKIEEGGGCILEWIAKKLNRNM